MALYEQNRKNHIALVKLLRQTCEKAAKGESRVRFEETDVDSACFETLGFVDQAWLGYRADSVLLESSSDPSVGWNPHELSDGSLVDLVKAVSSLIED